MPLLCKAIGSGDVTLSDSIGQYLDLPQGKYYPPLERLVTHTSGYKSHYFEGQMASNFFAGRKNDFYGITVDILEQKIVGLSLQDKDYPFNYSNFGISAVGDVLNHVYNRDYTKVMDDFILNDLALSHTRISDGTGDLQGYWDWRKNDAYLPAGGIISTIGDMLQYVQYHMTGELPYLSSSHDILAKVDAITKQYGQMGIRTDAVGIGWMVDTENNIIWHNGGTSNFNSYIGFDKDKQVGVVILSNLPPDYRIPATVMGPKLLIAL